MKYKIDHVRPLVFAALKGCHSRHAQHWCLGTEDRKLPAACNTPKVGATMSHRFTKYTRNILQNHAIYGYCKCLSWSLTKKKKQLLVGIMPWHFVAMNPQQPSPRQIVFVPDNNRPHVFTNSKTESLCVDDVTLEFHRQKAWLDCWLTLLQWYLNQSIPCCLQGLEKSATKHRSHVSLATCLHMIIYDNATIQTTRKTMQNLPTQDSWHQNTFATQNFLKASGAIEITISKFGCRSSDALISKTNSQ